MQFVKGYQDGISLIMDKQSQVLAHLVYAKDQLLFEEWEGEEIYIKNQETEELHDALHLYKDQKDVIWEWSEVLDRQPKRIDALYQRGLAYYESGFLTLAEKDFRKAIELDPYFGDPYHYLGKIKQDYGQMRQARDYFRKARSFN